VSYAARAMTIVDVYPLFTVARLADSRAFFVEKLGLAVVFEASWVAMLGTGDGGVRLGLMTSDHPSRPPGPEVFDGNGAIVTLQVDDAAAWHARLAAAGVAIAYGPADEPWGQRRFMVVDPSGIRVDIVEQTEPQAGFWEKYALPEA
jgi:catechol 2,3-dioxygenase-like lactoylglutathione lyase family enzyme